LQDALVIAVLLIVVAGTQLPGHLISVFPAPSRTKLKLAAM